jgi:DNA-binding protein HU-beta
MNKEELVEIIADAHDMPKVRANEIVRTLLSTIQDAVIRGDRVTLSGFGIFEAVNSKERTGHNPKTGEHFKIAAKRRPRFTPGVPFRNAVEGNSTTK